MGNVDLFKNLDLVSNNQRFLLKSLKITQENVLLIVKFKILIQFCYPQISRLQSLVDQEIDTY